MTSISQLAACLDHTDERRETASRALGAAAAAEHLIAEQTHRLAYLERLAHTDELTGLLNRHGFEGELNRALASSRRYDEEGALIYVDLDAFKPINDTHGHAAGDEVLRRVARLLLDNVRDTDYVARMGGDEFAVLLTRTNWDNALRRAETLDKILNGAMVGWQGRTIALRASFGIQAYGQEEDGHDLLHRADHAMYETKRLRAQLTRSQAAA